MSPLFYTLGHTFLNYDSLLCLPPLRNQGQPTFRPMFWTCHPQAWNLPPSLESVIREPPLCHMGLHSPQSPWHGVCLSMAFKPQLTSEAIVCLNAEFFLPKRQSTSVSLLSIQTEAFWWQTAYKDELDRVSFYVTLPSPISFFYAVFDFFF